MKTKAMNLSNILPKISAMFWRFPLVIPSAVLTCIFSMYRVHDIKLVSDSFVIQCQITAICATVLLLGVKLYGESRQWSESKHALGGLFTLVVATSLVWVALDVDAPTDYLLLFGFCACGLLVAAHLRRDTDNDSYWYFNYQSAVAVFFALLGALVLGIGCVLTLASIGYLFEIKIPNKFYGDAWVLAFSLYFPCYILANLPSTFDYAEQAPCDFPKGVRFIALYVLLPLMLVYLVVLYAYFGKILLAQTLPRGNLAMMIMTFGTIGVATKLVVYPICNNSMKLMAWFDRHFFHALVLPIVILYVSIYVRIEAHGVTELRYIVVMIALWLTVLTVMGIVQKQRFQLKTAPLLMLVMLLFAYVGPFSAEKTAINSQMARFEAMLTKHQLLVDGQVIKSSKELPVEDHKKLSTLANYLTDTQRGLDAVLPLFADLLAEKGQTGLLKDKHKWREELLDLAAIEYVGRYYDGLQQYIYHPQPEAKSLIIPTSDFDYVLEFEKHGYNGYVVSKTYSYIHEGQQRQITTKIQSGVLTATIKDGQTFSFDLNGMAKAFIQNRNDFPEPFVYDSQSQDGSIKAKLLIYEFTLRVTPDSQMAFNSINTRLLLKFE